MLTNRGSRGSMKPTSGISRTLASSASPPKLSTKAWRFSDHALSTMAARERIPISDGTLAIVQRPKTSSWKRRRIFPQDGTANTRQSIRCHTGGATIADPATEPSPTSSRFSSRVEPFWLNPATVKGPPLL